MRDTRRTTLVIRGAKTPPRAWNTSNTAPNRILFVKALTMLSFVLDHRSEDIDRILVDHAATADEFLDLLASLPKEFPGDVLLLRSGNNSFLSTASRAEGRLLYALKAADLQFYLETFGLVTARAAVAAAVAPAVTNDGKPSPGESLGRVQKSSIRAVQKESTAGQTHPGH